MKSWVTSVAELDGKVYIAGHDSKINSINVQMYDSYKDKWFALSKAPDAQWFSLVTIPCKKQLLAIGGLTGNNNLKVSNKVFAWDAGSQKWTTPYPDMPTARCLASSVSHGLAVIVAGGTISLNPWILTGAVEILQTANNSSRFEKPQWFVVTSLPHPVREPVPLIIDDNLFISVGFDDDHESTCNIVTTSLSKLLRSDVRTVWNKLPDMPYSSWSFNHYKSHLIIFTGDHRVEQPEQRKSAWELISQIHLYNPVTKSWDHVGTVPFNYLIGRSIHIRGNKLLFIAGLTGSHMIGKVADLITTCYTLTIMPK